VQNTPTSGGNSLPARETPFRENKNELYLGRSSSGGMVQPCINGPSQPLSAVVAGAVVNNGFFSGWDHRTALVAASWRAVLHVRSRHQMRIKQIEVTTGRFLGDVNFWT